jgi:hypothetical protein
MNGVAAGVVLGTPTVTDNRDRNPVVTNDAPGVFPYGTTIVTWRATDSAGNYAEQQQTVSVVDTQRPTFITVLSPVNVIATDPTGTTVALVPPIAVDACDGSVTATQVPQVGGFPVGESTVTWQAQDRSGNTSDISQVVTVNALRADLDVDGDVDNNDLNIVLAFRNTPVVDDRTLRDFNNDGVIDDVDHTLYDLLLESPGNPLDLNGDRKIDGLDARILVTLCTRPRCATQ